VNAVKAPDPSSEQHDVVIVGAGPAGLATAGALRMAGVKALVVDRAEQLGASWRGHYDRLHLHTVRWLSGLPGLRIPASEGDWVSRDGVVRYLEAYRAHHGLEIRTGVEVSRLSRAAGAAGGWELAHAGGTFNARQVVIATGYNHTPQIPDWPGRDSFAGELVHAAGYRNGEPYAGRDVLVVGAGNTGAEIAVDLAEHGAGTVWLAYRTPPHILRRSNMGVPAQVTGVLLRRVPTFISDALAEPVRKRTVPDLSSQGLPDPGPGVYTRARRGEIAILDVGLIDAIQAGQVLPVPAVVGFEPDRVRLADGRELAADAVIVATGYRRGLEPLVGHLGVIGAGERPTVHGAKTDARNPGLRFIGFSNPVSGMFREIAIDARAIAKAIVQETAAEPAAQTAA
jgi:putative flavoprotein involved in K+ transport